MADRVIDGILLKEMLMAGASIIEQRKEEINKLNVFPVPDGDTGTNMSLTFGAAVKEIVALSTVTVGSVAKALATGSLKGARGNSGVILSQLFRGFTKDLRDLEVVTVQNMALALDEGAKQARKAVLKPKEGTMLTVATDIAKAALTSARRSQDMQELLSAMLIEGGRSLAHTPEQLPVLKEAGVVDAGGMGLLAIYEGFYKVYMGEEVPAYISAAPLPADTDQQIIQRPAQDIVYGYCTEFFVQRFDAQPEGVMSSLRAMLQPLGDSMVVAGDEDCVKVHIHTNQPGTVLQYALEWGEIAGVKIDNMWQQNRELVQVRQAQGQSTPSVQPVEGLGVVTVAAGTGFADIFKDLGASVVIQGGQTMNPSMEDIYNGILDTRAAEVFVFPNNKNIRMAANQAAEAAQEQGRRVCVLPTLSVPQGIGGLIAFSPEASFEENQDAIQEAIDIVHSVQITRAVRDAQIDGRAIKKDDLMGIGDGQVMEVGGDATAVAVGVLRKLYTDDMSVITVYYGEGIEQPEAQALSDELATAFPDCDIEMYYGGQPLYPYVLSIE